MTLTEAERAFVQNHDVEEFEELIYLSEDPIIAVDKAIRNQDEIQMNQIITKPNNLKYKITTLIHNYVDELESVKENPVDTNLNISGEVHTSDITITLDQAKQITDLNEMQCKNCGLFGDEYEQACEVVDLVDQYVNQ